MSSQSATECEPAVDAPLLSGETFLFVGRLSGMSRPDAVQTVRNHGGEVVDLSHSGPATIVLGDEHASVAAALGKSGSQYQTLLDAVASDQAPVIYESELWQRIGLVDDCQVRRLYTPAMLAELIGVPAAAIRHWRRAGALRATQCIRRLPYFDFEEAAIARRLGRLYNAGCSLRVIDRKLHDLGCNLPHLERPIAESSILVEGRQIIVRRGEALAEPGGQRLLGFEEDDEASPGALLDETAPVGVLQFADASETGDEPIDVAGGIIEQLEQEALDWIDAGQLDRAAEAYRTILMANGPTPDVLFSLADVLYRSGDLAAARERLYSVLEYDEDFVEARANLGCVLAELGQPELAVSAFQGALERHPDFADVHFHLAGVLDRTQQTADAVRHYRAFLSLAPESPWALAARDRLEALAAHTTFAIETESTVS